jgi:hypothetical protein
MTSEVASRTAIQKLHRAWIEWLIPHRLRQSYRSLRHLVHCYPAPVGPRLPSEGLRTVEYFNPRLTTSFGDLHEQAGMVSNSPWSPPMDRAYWLFILASIDYEIQVALRGKAAFIDTLVARVRDANEADRHAVLIAPEECLATVRDSRELGDVTLIGFCDYRQYVSLLLFAEYAFYWNVASSSSIYRLVNRLPVFYFDRGHVSRWFESFYERTVEFLYRGRTPIMLDQREPLSPGRLRPLAETYRQDAGEIVRQLGLLPTPEEMVARLVSDGARSWE